MAKTIFEAYNGCKKELEAAGIEDFVFEAKQIIKHITGYNNMQILTKYNEKLTVFQENNLTAIIKQRIIRYPLQYIIGEWGFYGHKFYVGPGVLIPRSDTETVVDVCLEHIKKIEKPRILDLCAGSGCIGITLASEKSDAQAVLVEKYDEAARYIRKNIDLNKSDNVSIIIGDVLCGAASEGAYDLIVSNPPYIADADMKQLQPEVRFEPETALAGGRDGLDFYRAIIEKYSLSLSEGGMLVFEVGINQAQSVMLLLENAGFENISSKKDAGGVERVVFGTVKSI